MFERAKKTEVEESVPGHGHGDNGGEAQVIGRLRPSLASLMVDEGVATSEQLEQALAEGQQTGERLGEVVLRHGWINEAALAGLVARQWDLSFVALSAISVDESARALLSREVCQRVGACPVSFDEGGPMVAIADPSEDRFAAVRDALGTHCSFFVTTPSALAGLIDQQASAPADAEAPVAVEPAQSAEAEPEQPEAAAPATPAPPTLLAVPSEPVDQSAPVVDQLEQLLERLLDERERSRAQLADYQRQLADYQRQLAELEAEQARVRENMQALESKLGQEEQRLDSMRARLSESFGQQ